MGSLDRLESWRPYRWIWDREVFGHRPFTHTIRIYAGRWPGMLAYGVVCFALGSAMDGCNPFGSLANFLLALLFTIINGHLWV